MPDQVVRWVDIAVPGRSNIGPLLVLLVAILVPHSLHAQQGPRVAKIETTLTAVLKRLPLEKLSQQAHTKIRDVVSRPSLHQELPVRTITCSKDLYVHMVQHPEIVVNIWQLMGITELRMQRTDPFIYKVTDGLGTSSTLELIYGTPELHLFYAEGSYVGKWLGHRLQGRCLVILSSEFTVDQGRPQVKHALEVFVRLDDVAADVLARTFKPLIGKLIQYNFEQSSGFIDQVYEVAENRRSGMDRMVSRMTHVEPMVKQRFVRLLEGVKEAPETADREQPVLRR